MARRATGGLTGISVLDLRRELMRRERRVGALVRKHGRLVEKARAVEAEIMQLGGDVHTGTVTGRRRPKNDMNLVDALQQVLKDKVMSVTEVSEAVQKAGYRTTSPSFRTIVNQTLINSGKFKRVERGQYTVK